MLGITRNMIGVISVILLTKAAQIHGSMKLKSLNLKKCPRSSVFGDYTVSTIERQNELIAVNERKRYEQGIVEFYHFDTPFTPETEMRLMKAAGFASTEIVRQWENTAIIIARK